MIMIMRIKRVQLVQYVIDALRPSEANDLPAIRQALNDTADWFRKDGHDCPDFDQAAMVQLVQKGLAGKALSMAGMMDSGPDRRPFYSDLDRY
jgi:hypothetical protein